ncbi:glycosyltransferase WbuB [Corynebacterium sp. HMSC055A01]|uniref:glycosyltransferase family 4 protein n=1 Tax=Corynebacterium sp. HMSC055A01 TaxID=1715083 RepID=UPI0008A26157|nr:glycosyltransferase family 4 protein [Corynebacterium sp. HMSC055A01]OFN17696.1 glycosyltransferase WbuB [Corynebacterium sp. HMSC055A01]
MEVLIISQYWLPENGVPQRRWAWLSELLKQQGHSVSVIAPPPQSDRKIDFSVWRRERKWRAQGEWERGASGERIARSGFFPAGRSLTVRAINQAFVALAEVAVFARWGGVLKRYRPEVVIGTVPALPTSVVAWLAAKKFSVPYVIDLRDAWPDLLHQSESWNVSVGKVSLREKILSKGPLQAVSWITKRVLNRVLRDSAAIIATSSELADDLRTREELRKSGQIPPIFTIRNVFPVATEFRKSPEPRDGSAALRVLYAGTIGRAQDLQNALNAVEICKRRGVAVELRLVGAGAAKDALREQATSLGTAVKFEPRFPAETLDKYYEWADTALVHLADWEPLSRTVPSKLYELMETGVHVSAVVKGEAAGIVQKLEVGDVVSPNSPDELAQLWTELAAEPSRLEKGPTGREWVIYQRESLVPQTIRDVLESACSND